MNQQIAEPLSHNALRQILKEHAFYINSGGTQGQAADLSLYSIENFDFSNLDLSGVPAQSTVFLRCQFINTDLSGANFDRTCAPSADFRGANLVKAQFYMADLRAACFDKANLTRSEFIKSNLCSASFRAANLCAVSISESDLNEAIFDGSDIEWASFKNNQDKGVSWYDTKGLTEKAKIQQFHASM
ncbi:MAG: pentapeptide repeat-containing protein [Stigonema ocellatum SAG 48.90 = DSM 106950]|nr:pentapeptide repeat-containing protein [Stigonema ocellatum SAG 48.90 = DSM 106950]